MSQAIATVKISQCKHVGVLSNTYIHRMQICLVTWGNLNFSKRTEQCMNYSNTQYNSRYIKTLSLMLFITTEIIKCDKKYKIT